MEVIYGLEKTGRKFENSLITIGTFDGVHIGHQRIINEVIKRSNQTGGTSTVLTFNLHPLKVITPGTTPPLLSSVNHKIRLLNKLGLARCILIDFNRDFFTLEPTDFVKQILVDTLGVSELFLGNNYRFGKDRSGDIKLMEELADKYSFRLHKIKLVRLGRYIVSSSLIRSLVSHGKLQEASRFLGRPFSILGRVAGGSKRGRLLGYPTANIIPYHEVIPPSGVYAVKVKLDDSFHQAIVNIGFRPTFAFAVKGNAGPIIEVHIFDFSKSIYGSEPEIIFIDKIRNEKKFSSKEELIEQIKIDEEKAKKILR